MNERFVIRVWEWNAKEKGYEAVYKALFEKYEDAKTFFDGLKISDELPEKNLLKQTINWFGCVTSEELIIRID